MAASAFAQDEFSLPPFARPPVPDAGVVAPSPPPMPPPDVAPEPAVDTNSPLPPTPPAAPRPPPELRWNRIAGTMSGLFLALQNVYLGGELSFLGGFGAPERSQTEPGNAEGWLMQVGVQASYGRLTGPVCLGSAFCGARYAGGLAVKGGWGRGVPDRNGWTKAGLMFYAQVDVLAGYLDIPPAPLAPGASSWEGIARLRLGLHYASLGATAAVNKVTLNAAFIIEGIPFSGTAKGVSLGAALGIAF
ncbi:MAG: hypothetical protein AB1938_11435 [Myxococcota bacterium]